MAVARVTWRAHADAVGRGSTADGEVLDDSAADLVRATRLARATRPVVGWPASSPFLRSTSVWLALLAYLGAVELCTTFIGAGLEHDPRSVPFSWPSLGIFGSAGLLGIWLSHRTGFPAAWDGQAWRQRWLEPALWGTGFGLLAVVLDQLTHGIPFFLEQTGLSQFNAPFPGSVLFYPGGAILVELVYRLLPIPLLLWLISNVLLRGRGQREVVWVLAVTFRRAGFLAAIVLRVAMYLVWQVGYGNFVCAC